MSARRILVVDDDEGMVSTLSDILELRGWEAVRAYDGSAAIELAAKRDVDLVLMDVRMGMVDGFDALKEIRREEPSAKVILMSALATFEMAAEARAAGALALIRKPLDLPDLFDMLDTVVPT